MLPGIGGFATQGYGYEVRDFMEWGHPLNSLLSIIFINHQLMNNMVLVDEILPDLLICRKEVLLNEIFYG